MNWYKKSQDNSGEFEWHYDADEIFSFIARKFDIAKAKNYL
tara:strand:+ start:121 stop:243 length:123 start_codon:yes stop_codon:yes gene_type:complete